MGVSDEKFTIFNNASIITPHNQIMQFLNVIPSQPDMVLAESINVVVSKGENQGMTIKVVITRNIHEMNNSHPEPCGTAKCFKRIMVS